jgi:hypothetical protein
MAEYKEWVTGATTIKTLKKETAQNLLDKLQNPFPN